MTDDKWRIRRHLLAAAVLTGAAFCLYIVTLAPSVVTIFDDSLEFQLAPYLLAIPHPTGYPLYALLGWLFTRLPIGDVAYRMNLLSAAAAALTVGLAYLCTVALLRQRPALTRRWAAMVGAGAGAVVLAVSPVFWSQATIAEVYPLNLALVGVLLLSLLTLAADAVPGDWLSRSWMPRLVVMALLFGLGLAHHRTIVLLAPVLIWGIWQAWPAHGDGDEGGKGKTSGGIWWLLVLAALLLPLLLYLYLPLRAHVGSLDGAYENTPAGFLHYVTGSGYGGFIFDNPFALDRGVMFYPRLFWWQFGALGLIVGGFGLFVMLVMQRRGGAATLLAFALYSGFNLFYRVADIEVFFLPSFLIWAIWLGVGTAWLLQQSSDLARRYRVWGWAPVVVIVLLLVAQPGYYVVRDWEQRDRSNDWQVYDYGRDMLSQPLVAGAAIVGIRGEMTLLRYFQETKGLRRDIVSVTADDEERRIAVVEELLKMGRGVYLTRELAGAPERWSMGAVGPLVRVLPEPVLELPEVETVVEMEVTPEIGLYGYTFSQPPSHRALGPLRLTLVWHAVAPLSQELKVSARLVGPDEEIVAQSDGVPVHFAYPTRVWREGEYIKDVYDLLAPETLAPGEYTPVVIVYDPAAGAAEVGRVTLPALYLP
jgi:hypothetical protein